MVETPNPLHSDLLAFESFTLNTQTHALFSAAGRVHLTAKPLQVLEYLVAHAGKTVSKRELLDAVWSGLFVTEDVLVQAVGEIRRALGDEKGDPRFVQTIPREGYRFVARVSSAGRPSGGRKAPNPPATGQLPSSPRDEAQGRLLPFDAISTAPRAEANAVPASVEPPRTGARERRSGWPAPAALIAVFVVGGLAGLSWWWRSAHAEAGWGQPSMIAEVAGRPRMPSFSPDASMVAFVNEVNGVDQIFVKHVGQGPAVQVTFDDAPSQRPRWSPRNDEILYCKGGQTGASGPAFGVESIWSVPPLGGVPHLVVETARNPSWSRDGSLIVFERRDEVWIARADGSNPQRVDTVPRARMLLANRMPALSPDGRQIVFFQPESGPQGDLWITPVRGGQPKRLTFDICDGGSPAWTPDGRSVIFVSQRSGVDELWTVPSSGGRPVRVFGATGENGDPDVSADGRRLIFSNTRKQFVLTILDPATGQTRELLERRLAVSYPMFSPDADKLSFFSVQGEPGVYQICTMDVDGTHVNQVTRDTSERNKFPHWSPDGRSLYYYRSFPDRSYRRTPLAGGRSVQLVPDWAWETHYGARVDPSEEWIVYTVTRGGVPFRTLVRNIETGAERSLGKALDDPRWSADGRRVFGTDLRGYPPPEGDISICPADGGACRTVTRGYMPVPSRDNRSVYYLRVGASAESAELRIVSLVDGSERKVADLGPMRPIAHFYDVSPSGEIVYVQLKPGTRDLWVSERQ